MPGLADFLVFLKAHGYLAFVATLLISGLGVPLPEDIPLLVGGYLASPAEGILNLWVTILLAMTSIMGADCFFFFLGRRIREKNSGKMPSFLNAAKQKRIEGFFTRYGKRTCFFGRFMPGLRSPIFFCAGLWGVPTMHFIIPDGSAVLLSVPALVVIGYLFGDNLAYIQGVVGGVEYVIIGAIVLFVLISVIVSRVRAKREAAFQASQPPKPAA